MNAIAKRNRKAFRGPLIFCVCVYAVLLTLMAVGTFRDLDIDKALFDYRDPFGVFFSTYGMIPIHLVQHFAFCMLLAAYHPFEEAADIAQSIFPFFAFLRNNKVLRVILFALHKVMYAAFCYGAFMGTNQAINYLTGLFFGKEIQPALIDAGLNRTAAVIIWTVIRLAAAALTVFLLSRIKKEYRPALELMALTGLVMYFGSGIIGVLKGHFQRVRFREMIAYSHGLIDENGISARADHDLPREWIAGTDFSYFTRWYIPGSGRALYHDCTSFPSGHTTNASFSLLLIPLFYSIKKLRRFLPAACVIGIGWTGCVMFSRLLRGAHYLTDVSGAAVIMFTLMLCPFILFSYLASRPERKKRDGEKAR